MKTETKRILTALFILSFIILFNLNCSNENESTVNIKLGMVSGNTASRATTPPTTISSVSVRVTGSDMDDMNMNYAPADIISFNVPAGPAREFTVTAQVAPGDPSAALSFIGSTTADLDAGATVTLSITMGLYETKLLIPDQLNYRIIQIDDLTGTGWVAKTGNDIGHTSPSVIPSDVDFDALGRIYIANHGYSTGEDVVIRINNINDTAGIQIQSYSGNAIKAVAVDRINHMVYFAHDSQVFRTDYDGNNIKNDFNMTGILSINGLAVDEEGYLYIAHGTAGAAPTVSKYNPNSGNGGITATYTTGLQYPNDVIVKNEYVYILDYDNSFPYDSSRIVQLNKDLQYVTQLADNGSGSTGDFLGPQRFAAILNRRFYICDDDGNDYNQANERILAFDDMLGSNWEFFVPSAIGEADFNFFEQY